MVSKREIEAAIKAFQMAHTAKVDIPLEQSMRDALEAAARVREEDNAGEPVAWGEDIDGKIVSVRIDKSQHCTVPLYRAPQPSESKVLVERQTLEDVRLLVARINSLHPIESAEVHQVYDEICRALNSLIAGKSEQVPSGRPETVDSVLLDAVRKIASEDLTNCANMTTAEIFGALSRMHETASQALRRVKESGNDE